MLMLTKSAPSFGDFSEVPGPKGGTKVLFGNNRRTALRHQNWNLKPTSISRGVPALVIFPKLGDVITPEGLL